MMISAYSKRLNESWEQTRFISYVIYCSATDSKGRKDISEFLPLDGDPTPEERLEARRKVIKERQAMWTEFMKEAQAAREKMKLKKEQKLNANG